MFCSAMVLLTLLSSTTTSSQNPSSCKPAACSDLCITYPFWIGGTHPPECGYHTFQVKCVDGRAYLRPYQIFNISYKDNSFRVIDDKHSYDICDTELNINASSDLGLTPFGISATNQELFFLYNCIELRSQPPPPAWAPVNCLDGFTESTSNSFAWLAGGYRPDDKWSSLPGACRVSMMPVLGYKGTSRADYRRLMKCRSLFEYTGDDCKVCEESGGLCRINTTYDIFECHSSDRISPSTCGELHTHNSGSEFDLCKNDAPV